MKFDVWQQTYHLFTLHFCHRLFATVYQQVPGKRICLGGRGREWAAESLKLLESMSELKDAKMFLEPMDPLKYAVCVNAQ